MPDPRRASNLSMLVVAVVSAAGMTTSCTQSMPPPQMPSLTPVSSATAASTSSSTPTTTASTESSTTTTTTTTTTETTTTTTTTTTETTTPPTSSSTSTTTTSTTAVASAPKVIVGDSVLTAKGPVQCTDDTTGIRTIKVGPDSEYTAEVTSDENFSVVKMDFGVVDGVRMQVRTSGGSAQGRKSGNSYSIEGTAQGTDPSTRQVVKKDFKFEATCP